MPGAARHDLDVGLRSAAANKFRVTVGCFGSEADYFGWPPQMNGSFLNPV
jgi:hypothetical protein